MLYRKSLSLRLLRGLPGILIAGFVVLGVTAPLQDDECKAEFADFRDGPWKARMESSRARVNLLNQLDTLIRRYERTAPHCGGRLREYQTFLLVLEGRYDEASDIIQTYLDGIGRNADKSLRLRLLRARGYALERMGQIRASSQEYFAAAALANRADARSGITALMDAATSANILRDHDAEEQYLDEALRLIADSLRGTSEYEEYLGQVYSNRALRIDDLLEASEDSTERRVLAGRLEDLSRRALALLPEADSGHRATMMGANALALALLGQRAAARRQIEPVLDLAYRSRLMVPSGPHKAWEYWSRIHEANGDLGRARAAALEARKEAVDLGNGVSERAMIRRLGHLAERESDWEEAARIYTEAIEYEESYRGRLGLQDWTTQAFSRIEAAYRGLVRSQLAMGDPEAAFLTLDRTRARYLRDLRRHLNVRAALTPERREQADSIQTALEAARISLLQSDLRGADQATITYEVSKLQESLEALTGSSADSAPDLDLRTLQTALAHQDRTLISYFLDPNGSVAFVVRADTLVTVSLQATPASVEAHLQGAGALWRTGEPTLDPAFRLGALHRLYREIAAPLLPWIEGTPSLVVIPDRALGGVPLGMLTTAESDDYATAPYLVRRFAIATELAASMVSEVTAEPPRGTAPLDLLAYGRSRFGSSGFTWNGSEPLTDLEHVTEEVRRIGSGVRSREIALNEEATEDRLETQIASARIVHIASHAEADPELPLYSKIALWEGEDDDGILYLYELQNQPLRADLVVLSGCSTARGRHQNGEGMVGLQYAVRSAGARASLATLWPVDDEASVELMGAFYDGLKDGLPKDRALQQAQLRYLDAHDGLSASPFFWAGPLLSGDTAPVPIGTTRPLWWLALVPVGLGVAWYFHRRRRLDA